MKRWVAAAALLTLVHVFTYEQDARAIDEVERGKTTINVERRKKDERKAPERAKVTISRTQIYLTQVEARLLKGIDKTKKYLSEQAKKRPKGSPTRFQFLEKVLNLNLEHAILQRNQEEKDYEKAYNRWDAAGAKGQQPKIDTSESNKLWNRTALLAGAILQEYPKTKRADAILYNKAFALEFLGKRDEASRMYTELVQKYPNSVTAGEAYFSLGEYFFDKSNFRSALENYRQANKYKRSKRYGWSLFKYAWCEYNLSKYSAALRAFKLVVAYSRTQGDKGVQLKEEALRDMVYVFAEQQDVNGAIAYYRANGGRKYIGPMLKLLSQTLADQGKFSQAISVAQKLQSSEPYSAEAPEVQKFIIELYNDLGRKQNVWSELDKFGKLYGPKSAWFARNKGNRKLILETQKMIRDQMIYYAKITHKEAIDNDNREGHMQAKRGYELFLRNYPDAPETPEIMYNLADIAYYLKDYREAGQLYMKISMMGPKKAVVIDPNTKKESSIHKQSSEYMLGAYGEDYKREFDILKKKKPSFKGRPLPLSSRAKNYIRACGLYTKWYAKDVKRVKTCDLDVTKIYYLTNNKKMAKKYLWMVAKKYPDSPEGVTAVEEVIPLYAGDREGLVAAVGELLKVPQYKNGKLGEKLQSLLRDTEIDVVQNEKNPEKQAQMYERLARKSPKAPGADALWYNSAVKYRDIGNLDKAMANFGIVIKHYSKSDQFKKALLEVMKLSEQRYDYASAVNYSALYISKYKDDKESKKEVIAATALVCKMSIALNSDSAWQRCNLFAQYDPGTASYYLEKIIVDAWRNNEDSKVVKLTSDFMQKHKLDVNGVIRSNYRLYKVTGSKMNSAAANNVVKAFQSNPKAAEGEALRYVAELYFRDAMSQLPRYTKVNFVGGSVDTLLGSMQKKSAALASVSDFFGKVLQSGDSYWGVAALYEQGKMYEAYAKGLEDPPGIEGASINDVKKQLAPQAKEARNKANELFVSAKKSMEQFNVYSSYSQKILDAVLQMNGKNSREFDQFIVKPDFIASEVPTSIAKQVQGN